MAADREGPFRVFKAIARRILPRSLYLALAYRYSRYSRLRRKIVRVQGRKVATGPFAGMVYLEHVGRSVTTKLLGSYEAELHPAVRDLVARGFALVLNVGCAEGYYAVGLARAMPQATVYAFDTNPRAQDLCRELAEVNGVADRITIEGTCDRDRLNQFDLRGALLVVDVEGYELELLQPDAVPGLEQAAILVELHDHAHEGLTETVVGRFEPTHDVEVIQQAARDPNDYPTLAGFREADQALALEEFRTEYDADSPQRWAVMWPKKG